MGRGLHLAESTPYGPNPRVGCVIVDDRGAVVGEGWHRGAGTAHAEVAALAAAGERSRGATAVVTMEPCRHTGRTGPCTEALLAAGIVRVVFGQADPTEVGGGGAAVLQAAGVEVVGGVRAAEAERLNREWTVAVQRGRPFVTWKCATSLDGRVGDGGPTSLTGPEAQREVHRLRARVGAIVIGTGTALIDDPALTVRLPPEEPGHAARPLRVVVGRRPIPAGARVLDDTAPTLLLDERDPRSVLAALAERDVRHVLLEGGPTLAAAFLAAGCVDRIDWYVTPVLLGDGPVALPPGAFAGVAVEEVTVLGEDVRVVGAIIA
jgi:diaminohydroxyphosphoribosylaminopyrimidine deaminase/5-amino-6-(5-phosphoribosylamino)uracil reductase